VARFAAELGLHRLPPEVAQAALQPLLDSEFERAHALWVRRYGQVADTPEERVRQHRFLTARGFGAEVVRRVIRGDGLQFED
jgi:regulatory protein